VREVSQNVTPCEGRLEVAGIVGSRSVTVAALKYLVAQLNQFDVAVNTVPVSIPSHCAFIDRYRGPHR
jgi:hypothetical protein